MDTILVACETIEDEINGVMGENSLSYPVIWLEGGLHNSPERLRSRIQEVFNQVDGRCQRLLMSLGFCGGGVLGLMTGNYQTVLPMADDCITLLLGSVEARLKAGNPATYFLTGGWLRHENNIVESYWQTVGRYGQKQADRINGIMFKNYHRFGLVETGCYHMGVVAKKIGPLAGITGMTIEELPSDRSWLNRLLTGPYDDPDQFIVLQPHTLLNFDHWSPLLDGQKHPTTGTLANQLTEVGRSN